MRNKTIKNLKLLKNDVLYSVWCIWGPVWWLPEKVHVTSINNPKSISTKLLMVSGVSYDVIVVVSYHVP